MMRTTTISIPILLSIAACSGEPAQRDTVDLLAVACAVSTDEAIALLAPADETCDGNLHGACCTVPGACVEMDYPETVCYGLPGPTDAQVLEKDSEVATTANPPTMFYENCPPEEGEPPPTCTADNSGTIFLADASTDWIANFLTDAAGNVYAAELYRVPEGGGAVQLPDDGDPQALVHYDDPFADHDLEVETPDGPMYGNITRDCIPREGGCGFTCWKC